MADFCKQCSIYEFGRDYGDLAGGSTQEDTQNNLFCVVICESCGVIQVDHEGRCVSQDCLKHHGLAS